MLHPALARDANISQRAEGTRADIGRWHVLLNLLYTS